MGDCTKAVGWVKDPTCEDVKQLYMKFNNVATQMGCEKMLNNFNFRCGSMSYTAESIEEFMEKAFGEKEFRLNALQFMGMYNDDKHVRINYLSGLSISATTKVLLACLEEKLNVDTKEDDMPMKEKPTTEAAENQIAGTQTTMNGAVNSPITVTGSGNTINIAAGSISNNQTVDMSNNQHEEKKNFLQRHQLLSTVLAGVLAGIILFFDCWEEIVDFIEVIIRSLITSLIT